MGPNSGIVRRETLPQTEETLATYNPFQDILQRNGFSIINLFTGICMCVCVCVGLLVCVHACVLCIHVDVCVCVCACMRVMRMAGCVPRTSQHQVKPV